MTFAEARAQLVEELRRKGIQDERVLEAIGRTRRERFVPEALQTQAYEDRALPIGSGQTISQPFIVALMTEALELQGDETVLEIGTGSGYQAAIVSQLCSRVVTIERLPELSEVARRVLEAEGYTNIIYAVGDGTLGWPQHAPYDGILVTAAAPLVPPSLYAQLAPGGRMVIPVGDETSQELQVITRTAEGPRVRSLCDCAFVKLIGQEAWA